MCSNRKSKANNEIDAQGQEFDDKTFMHNTSSIFTHTKKEKEMWKKILKYSKLCL